MPRHKTKSLVRRYSLLTVCTTASRYRELINRVMLDGKKQIAERLVYGGMQKAAEATEGRQPTGSI